MVGVRWFMGRGAASMPRIASFRESFLLSINISGWLLRRETPSWLEGASPGGGRLKD